MHTSLIPRGLALTVALALSAPVTVRAQDKLTSYKAVSTGIVVEVVSFGSGLAQSTNGAPSTIQSATQILVPVSLSMPLTTGWSFDMASLYSTSQAKFGSTSSETANLAGVGDVRLRLSGKLMGDALVMTLGANIPTGVHDLTGEQIAALSVLAAPALGIYLPAVSSGGSQTLGLVTAHWVEDWSFAAGLSYELRNQFSPVAALANGLSSPKFDPGDAVHLSLGGDGLVGEHSLSVTAIADVYTEDKLLASGSDRGSRVKLGPTIGIDATLRLASTSIKDPAIYVSERVRGAFNRDGQTVGGSSVNYLAAGIRGARPLSRSTDLTAAFDAWNHSGILSNHALVTAATTSASVTLGLDIRSGQYSFRPFIRSRAGTIDTGVQTATMSGASFGMSLVSRF
jgi:hypothetical protein